MPKAKPARPVQKSIQLMLDIKQLKHKTNHVFSLNSGAQPVAVTIDKPLEKDNALLLFKYTYELTTSHCLDRLELVYVRILPKGTRGRVNLNNFVMPLGVFALVMFDGADNHEDLQLVQWKNSDMKNYYRSQWFKVVTSEQGKDVQSPSNTIQLSRPGQNTKSMLDVITSFKPLIISNKLPSYACIIPESTTTNPAPEIATTVELANCPTSIDSWFVNRTQSQDCLLDPASVRPEMDFSETVSTCALLESGFVLDPCSTSSNNKKRKFSELQEEQESLQQPEKRQRVEAESVDLFSLNFFSESEPMITDQDIPDPLPLFTEYQPDQAMMVDEFESVFPFLDMEPAIIYPPILNNGHSALQMDAESLLHFFL